MKIINGILCGSIFFSYICNLKHNKMYYNKPDDVLFINPLTRFLAKIFTAEKFIIRCKVCNKIPTDVYGNTCINHINDI